MTTFITAKLKKLTDICKVTPVPKKILISYQSKKIITSLKKIYDMDILTFFTRI